jgi:citrate lyase subunit beta/citryl-CoA lyase
MTVRPPLAGRLRRSAHFVPGGNEKMLARALETRADSLILDLEDAVVPERKDEVRRVVAGWLKDAPFGAKERTVRINPMDTPWGLEDLRATMVSPPDAYVVPKISTLDELMHLDQTIAGLEAKHGHSPGKVGLIVIATETPQGVLNLPTFSQCPRVVALSWGAEDLSAAIGAPRNRRPDGTYLDVFQYCRTQTLLCAAAGRVQPIDTVFVDIRDEDGLRRESQEGAWMGYTGKITIHPAQIDIVNEVFSPTKAEIEEAERLVAAFAQAQAEGRMAFAFEGKMVDVPHLTRAQNILSRARQIRELA